MLKMHSKLLSTNNPDRSHIEDKCVRYFVRMKPANFSSFDFVAFGY